eukprot:GEMP01060939.1.p1 GENE.GEMP01060939.1~~GEMP01060939.1.p1  ORF type:complete len:343 (+),score=81.78 GEMP01060939.1:78-1106(+)
MLRLWVFFSFLAAVGSRCPLEACHKKRGEVLLQLSEPNHPLPYSTLARRVNKVHDVDENGHTMYNVDFKPADFTCLKCDVKTCEACDVVCDLSMCIGRFYEHECWCRKDTAVRLNTPLWQFRKFDSRFLIDDSVHRFFCDDKCGEGACGIKGLQCRPRAEACQPWWWCNLPPPRKQEKAEWPTDEFRETFLQKQTFLRKNSVKNTGERKFEKNDYDAFNFTRGRWVCSSASYPPKIMAPTTYLWQDRGYIVFDGHSCEGATFEHQCYCWDEFKYLKRENAHIGAFTCDDKCMFGTCEGRTCGDHPPPPLPAPPPPPPIDPLEAEKIGQATLNNIDVEMNESS